AVPSLQLRARMGEQVSFILFPSDASTAVNGSSQTNGLAPRQSMLRTRTSRRVSQRIVSLVDERFDEGAATMLNEAAHTFLWSLFRLGLFGGNPKQAIEWVASLYDRDLEFPAKVEKLLTDYWSSGEREIL